MSLGRARRTQNLRGLPGFGGRHGFLSHPWEPLGSGDLGPRTAAEGTEPRGCLLQSALPQTAENTTGEVMVQGMESKADSTPFPWKLPGLPQATSLTGALRLILS